MASQRAAKFAETVGTVVGIVAARLWRFVIADVLWAIIFLVAGGVLIYLGVLEIWGRGYAFLSAGIMLALTGVVLVRGLTRGG